MEAHVEKFRFLSRSWKAPWILSPCISDSEAVAQGFILGGQGRDASNLSLSERAELYALLKRKTVSGSDPLRREALLSRVPFTRYLGILDIDVNTTSPDFNPESSAKKALGFAQKLAYHSKEFGFGNPNWYSTGYHGSFHAALLTPPDMSDIDLLAAIKLMVTDAATALDIPLYLKLPKEKDRRTDVYIDDSALNKSHLAKGGVWRLVGTSKPGGKAKTLVDVLAPGCPEIERNELWTPLDRDVLQNALERVRSQKIVKDLKPEPISVEITGVQGELSPEDLEFLQAHGDLLEIWDQKTRFGSRFLRDRELVRIAIFYGADDGLAVRLMYAMPGSKASEDKRDANYAQAVLRSAKRYPTVDSGKYESYLKPMAYSNDQRHVIYKASTLTESYKVCKKLKATLSCGEVAQHSTIDDRGMVLSALTHRCERVTCQRCELRRLYLQIERAVATWPEQVTYISLTLPDDSPKTPQMTFKGILRQIRKKIKKGQAKLTSRFRTFRAPSELVIIHPSPRAAEKLAEVIDPVNIRILSREECIAELKKVLYKRFLRLLVHINNSNAKGLAEDPWAGHVVCITGGRKADKRLPWLSKTQIRAEAKVEAPEQDTAKATYYVVGKDGKILRTRKGVPFNRREMEDSYVYKPTSREIVRNQKPPD